MTKEEAMAWVHSLKPGDKVIHVAFLSNKPIAVLIVKKVTPTGIVRTTANESFRQSRWSPNISGYGYSIGYIIPYDDELADQVAEYQREQSIQKENNAIFKRAEQLCYEFYFHKRKMSLAIAKKIIRMIEDEKKEKENHGMAE